jgi:RNA recognition motif-containing protein
MTGIGIERDNKTTPATSNQTDTRVYVNNLPMDITEEELGK